MGGSLIVKDRNTERVRLWWDSKGALGLLLVPVCDRARGCTGTVLVLKTLDGGRGIPIPRQSSPAHLFAGSGADFGRAF